MDDKLNGFRDTLLEHFLVFEIFKNIFNLKHREIDEHASNLGNVGLVFFIDGFLDHREK